jgi:carbon monoxide dehydrogenase subunit G
MTEISSEELSINRSSDRVYNFLNDLRNYENLMPSDVTSFSATEENASLDLKGLGKFTIDVAERVEGKKIRLKPTGKLPFQFDIEWLISSVGDQSKVVGKINAELNMFMKMMAEPKLRSFVDKQAYKLKEYLESEIK